MNKLREEDQDKERGNEGNRRNKMGGKEETTWKANIKPAEEVQVFDLKVRKQL